ncbi:hypothetical protein MF271_01940 (plasmid) [Deinococcus sp. KNUC1210]|uniref:hypothetical protein n=1 Tax=Deinococcus sp. KNUC1210 TaxID=2917691 RepID=UPI001EF11F3F|nr:hypothetical protein [Deinococcus sp. KNUC1210]ULH14304.1 hypothetical protein MF271_01940 [Deinococcus sp. KNUC1210]
MKTLSLLMALGLFGMGSFVGAASTTMTRAQMHTANNMTRYQKATTQHMSRYQRIQCHKQGGVVVKTLKSGSLVCVFKKR